MTRGYRVFPDGEGFVTIAGRAARFKIAGEMISLAVSERTQWRLFPIPARCCRLAGSRRGERLVLAGARHPKSIARRWSRLHIAKVCRRSQSRAIVTVPTLPVLGSGKRYPWFSFLWLTPFASYLVRGSVSGPVKLVR
jgi:hypothetical protein